MSIEQLKTDLKQVIQACPADPAEIPGYLQNYLLSWLEATCDEIGEMDDAIENLVHESEDILHSDNAAMFAGVITSGMVLATELAARAGNDQRLLKVIKEFRALAKQASDVLEEITIPDDDEEEEDDGAEDDKSDGQAEGKGA
jgi:hypothetical protein